KIKDVIQDILDENSNCEIEIGDELIHIYSPYALYHPNNLLNVQISEFQLTNESLAGARYELINQINVNCYPEFYENGGYGGGFGGNPDSIWMKKNINLSLQNVTIRDILNKVITSSGNGLWFAEINEKDLEVGEPFWRKPNEPGESPINSRWKIILFVR